MNNLVEELTRLGSKSIEDSTLCALTYMELKRRQDKQLLFNVAYKYNTQLGKLYCESKTFEDKPSKVYLPISSSTALDIKSLGNYFNLITDTHEPNLLVLVIWEADNTFVFYEISKGLGSPIREISQRRKAKKQKNTSQEEAQMPSTSSQQ